MTRASARRASAAALLTIAVSSAGCAWDDTEDRLRVLPGGRASVFVSDTSLTGAYLRQTLSRTGAFRVQGVRDGAELHVACWLDGPTGLPKSCRFLIEFWDAKANVMVAEATGAGRSTASVRYVAVRRACVRAVNTVLDRFPREYFRHPR